ncbi:MAG: hypothetical protein QM680_13785 [Luteolibacter sp.]
MRKYLLTKLFLILAGGLAFAGAYQSGERVESFLIKDQHDVSFQFEPRNVRYLLVSHDMETGKKANAVLSALGKDYLPARKAVFLANIHGMPAVGRAFALPKMRKYTHQILLGDSEELMARFPQETGEITILKITDGKVESIGYWNPAAGSVADYLK